MPGTILHGHTSHETAYVVDDYPYGRTVRCKIRYWIETAEKGANKGKQRIVTLSGTDVPCGKQKISSNDGEIS